MLRLFAILAFSGCLLLSAVTAGAQDQTYSEYKRIDVQRPYFDVTFDREAVTITVYSGDSSVSLSKLQESLEVTPEVVELDPTVYFDGEGLHFSSMLLPYDSITETRITDTDENVKIAFFTITGQSTRAERFRRGNRVSFKKNLDCREDEFVRGLMFTVVGDIRVYGEVNKDVISLFGNVYVELGAVVRGDIASVTGNIDVDGDAQVYGELYSSSEYFAKRKPRFYRHAREGSIYSTFDYNRVDGATPALGVKFTDADSLLPTVWAQAGYALESERWRTEVGLEQTIWRERPLVVGAAYYRRLASQDDWLLGEHENIIFTLLATEDFKDYYEAEGGTAWLKFRPIKNLWLEGRYRNEETNWLRSYRQMWSLFGGDKAFRKNFSSVPDPYRGEGIAEIDTTANASVSGRVDFDTRKIGDPFARSAWHFTGKIEWSSPDLNSDFDYRRYTLSLRRYQKIHRWAMVLLRGMYGGSDGYLPMYERFYLGGLGTLRGYKFKEYMGSRFWMANAEYRIWFPKTDLGAALFWDGGQIANDAPIDSNVDFKQSIGVGLFLGDDVRINLSRRLDRSYDNDPKLYVRFDHVF